ncbi:hypothetical protein SLU01_35730 [Sporosarcina luteola]|uniref:Uncharacterized protein n=1 Tax=Sporosarcina luteola TaxID=582850 RepID=A0A511ZCV5_9BACL|nr:hypothetical protein [Sporosarcina luteola]GEN85261.1 hypothetical protein SLU01_35730 [Sporosarcina luteola]
MKRILFLLFILLTLTVGCNKAEVNDVTVWTEAQGIANGIAEDDRNADIFMFNDRVYEIFSSDSNSKDSSEEKIGEIQKVYSLGDTFQNGMATKLPIGAKVYTTSIGNSFLLVNVDG